MKINNYMLPGPQMLTFRALLTPSLFLEYHLDFHYQIRQKSWRERDGRMEGETEIKRESEVEEKEEKHILSLLNIKK